MRESKFIQQNKKKWADFEKELSQERKDWDKLNKLFIQVTDDLSYSRTFYPNRAVRLYLNNLAQKVFKSLYKTRKVRLNKVLTFWTYDLPKLVYESRTEFILSFSIFILAALIGVFSTIQEPEFPRIILGDDYVEMTIANIEKGDPMAVYKGDGKFGMFSGIAINNIRVSFLTFVTGLFAGLGTILVLIKNGVMVGAFQYFFIQRGVVMESLSTIWLHGTIEILCIIIAGAAGLVVGRGLLFPGTYTRSQSLVLAGKRGLNIMLGIVPLIALAAFIEGFITRYANAPLILKLGLIGASLALMFGYFAYYPYRLWKANRFEKDDSDKRLPFKPEKPFEFYRLRAVGDVLMDAVKLFRKSFGPIFMVAATGATVFSTIILLFFDKSVSVYNFITQAQSNDIFDMVADRIRDFLVAITQFFDFGFDGLLYIPVTLFFGLVSFTALWMFFDEFQPSDKKEDPFLDRLGPAVRRFLFPGMAVSAIFNAVFFLPASFSWMVILILAPILMIWVYSVVYKGLGEGFGRGLKLFAESFKLFVGTFLAVAALVFIFQTILSSPLLDFLVESIRINFTKDSAILKDVMLWLFSFISVMALALGGTLMLLAFGFAFVSSLEVNEAKGLKNSIDMIGTGKTYRGMERES